MTVETVLQHWILTDFVYPFLLVFTIVFAVLEKTKILGDGKHQIDAIVAFAIGLIFVGAVYPKMVVGNMILFLTVAMIVVFVFLFLWSFIVGGEIKIEGKLAPMVKIVAGIIVFIAVAAALLWNVGAFDPIYTFLFQQSWSKEFWTNAIFVLVVVGAVAAVIASSKGGGKSSG